MSLLPPTQIPPSHASPPAIGCTGAKRALQTSPTALTDPDLCFTRHGDECLVCSLDFGEAVLPDAKQFQLDT